MLKKQQFNVNFDLTVRDGDQEPIKVDLLPCKYEKDIENTNRDIFFDPCIQQSESDNTKLTVHLQGRKMIGQTHNLSDIGYEGRVLGMTHDEMDHQTMQRNLGFQAIQKFAQITEWQKDTWIDGEPLEQEDTQRKYGGQLMQYLECAKVLH